MQVELTIEEAQTLTDCLDIATKSGGLAVGIKAVPLFHKLQAAATAPEKEVTDDV